MKSGRPRSIKRKRSVKRARRATHRSPKQVASVRARARTRRRRGR